MWLVSQNICSIVIWLFMYMLTFFSQDANWTYIRRSERDVLRTLKLVSVPRESGYLLDSLLDTYYSSFHQKQLLGNIL